MNFVSKSLTHSALSTTGNLMSGGSDQFTAGSTLTMSSGGQLSMQDNNILTAGKLTSSAPAFPTGLILNSEIAEDGRILLSGNTISMGNSNQFNENGIVVSVTATGGDVQMGNSNTFTARGGNVIVLADANLSGGTGNQFFAQGVQNTLTGGVELGAGTTKSRISTAFTKPFGYRFNVSKIQGIVDVSLGHGAIVLNPLAPTGINMSTVGPSQFVVDLARNGVAAFDCFTGATIQFKGGGKIQTESSSPVAFASALESPEDLVVDADVDVDSAAQ